MTRYQEDAHLVAQQQVAECTYRMRLRCGRIAASARAGQFLMLQVRSGNAPLLKRPFSFHRLLPAEGVIEILYRVTGQGTLLLSQALPGACLNVVGPLGNGFRLPEREQRIVALIAGGIGIAPFEELLMQLVNADRPEGLELHLFYGARTAAEMIPIQSYENLGVRVHCSTDDGTYGYRGVVTDLFLSLMGTGRFRPSLLYACGPLVMQVQVAKWALAANVPAQLSLEALMACGLGACLGCALPAPHPDDPGSDHYLHVCKDGPIFNAGSIAWTRLQRQLTAPRISLYN